MELQTNTDSYIGIAIGYIRVSTPEQASEGLSLLNQERTIKDYCAREHLKLVSLFEDRGVSAGTSNRPGFQDALAYCAEHSEEISAFIVYDLSRFARNAQDQLALNGYLKGLGIQLISTCERIEDNPGGMLLLTILGGVNEYQRSALKIKVSDGMLQRRLDGRPTNPLPIGLINARDDADKSIGLRDEVRAPFIELAFKRMRTGTYTLKALLDHLNNTGLTTKHGKLLSMQSLSRLLRNQTYTGKIKVSEEHGWEKSDYIPRLVNDETFEQVQMLLDKRRGNKPIKLSKFSKNFSLTVFVGCPCGGKLTGSKEPSQTGKRYPYYFCRESCGAPSIPKDVLENAFIRLLKSIRPATGIRKAFKAIVKDVYEMKQHDTKNEISRLERRLDKLERRRKKLRDNWLDEKITLEMYKPDNADLTKGILDTKLLLNDRRSNVLEIENVIESAFSVLTNIDKVWLSADTEIRRRIQRVVFPDGLLYHHEDGFKTPVTSKAFNILEVLNTDDSHLLPLTGFELFRRLNH